MNALKNHRYRNVAALFAGLLFTGFVVLQVNSPKVENPPVTSEFHGPEEVTRILKRSCYDCHSNESNLRWYDKVAPFSYKVAADVEEARKRFNFSEWDSIPKAEQEGKLWYIVNMIDAGRMPLPEYAAAHPSAKVTPAELAILKKLCEQHFPQALCGRRYRCDCQKAQSVARSDFHQRHPLFR